MAQASHRLILGVCQWPFPDMVYGMQPTPMTDPLRLGVSWYPEMWPEDQWEGDARRMAAMGLSVIRVFEFAWKRLEPSEGVYDLAWARRVLDLLHAHGLQAMVGTPTAAPPAWLTSTYPEVLGTKADGRRDEHGQRKHYNHHSRRYRELCRGIVRRMVIEFAGHPALHSWQIDNEMSGSDYGVETRSHFHAWLARRYGTIEELNRRWGLNFWSQAYDRFDQINLISAAVGSIEIPERHHPSLIVAIAEFQNEAWSSFIGEQCAEIRAGSGKPITTNMAGGLGGMDWFLHNQQLDRVGHSLYADLEHYHYQFWKYDRMRAEKAAPYWVLESAPNWSATGRMWNIHHDAGGMRAFAWLGYAMGGSMVMWWQWRAHWAGQEMQHGVLTTATGKPAPNCDAVAALAGELERVGPWLSAHPAAQARIGLVASNQAAWAFSIDPIEDNFRYEGKLRDDWHMPLVGRQWWRDLVHPEADIDRYRALVLPIMPQVPEALRRRLAGWVERGGRLLIGPLTGYRTAEFTQFTDRELGGLEDLIGADVACQFPLHWVEDRVAAVGADGVARKAHGYAFGFAPRPGCDTLATWRYTHERGGYGAGTAAVVHRRLGAGEVIVVGAQLDGQGWLPFAEQLFAGAGLAREAEGDPEVVVCPRASADGSVAGWVVVNRSEQPRRTRLPAGGTDLLTGRQVGPELQLGPVDVLVIRK